MRDDEHKESISERARDHSMVEIREEDDLITLVPVTLAHLRYYAHGHRHGLPNCGGSFNEYIQHLVGDPTAIADLSDLHIQNADNVLTKDVIDLTGADLSYTYCHKTIFDSRVCYDHMNIMGGHIQGAQFINCDLSTSNFSGVWCNKDTDFKSSRISHEQFKEIFHEEQLHCQRKGIRVISVLSGVVTSAMVTVMSGGAGLIPVALSIGAGLTTTAVMEGVGTRVLVNEASKDGVADGKVWDSLATVGALEEVATGPMLGAGTGLGLAAATRGLPYVPVIGQGLAVAALGVGVYRARGAIYRLGHDYSAAEVVAREQSLRDEMKEMVEDAAEVGAAAAEALDNIPMCRRLKNAAIVGFCSTLVIGMVLLGLALGQVIDTKNLPDSLTAFLVSAVGTFAVSTGLAYCFDKPTAVFVSAVSKCMSFLNKCCTCCCTTTAPNAAAQDAAPSFVGVVIPRSGSNGMMDRDLFGAVDVAASNAGNGVGLHVTAVLNQREHQANACTIV
jgi:hypothetical protein